MFCAKWLKEFDSIFLPNISTSRKQNNPSIISPNISHKYQYINQAFSVEFLQETI